MRHDGQVLNPFAKRNRGPWRPRPLVVHEPVLDAVGRVDVDASAAGLREFLEREQRRGLGRLVPRRVRRQLADGLVESARRQWAATNDGD